jgi:hypothetical protein
VVLRSPFFEPCGVECWLGQATGTTPLHTACLHGAAEVVEVLLGVPGVLVDAVMVRAQAPL